jgi:hypothetical protein
VKPEVGASEDTWGAKLNEGLDKIDDLLDGTTAIKPNLTAGEWKVGGVAVTATAAELNILDGVTATAAELNQLDTNTFASPVAFPAGTAAAPSISNTGDTNTGVFFPAADTVAVATNGAERMRVDSSGNVGIGTTSNFTSPTSKLCVNVDTWGIATRPNSLGQYRAMTFLQSTGDTVGIIDCTTTSTTYATSSDYRLKENVQPMQDALAVIAQLNPVTYTWKADGSDGQGFIAHELQAVVPDCVTGEKDAVDAEGNPKYQGVDTSFLVGILTKAIQEQQALITALTARVAALEA